VEIVAILNVTAHFPTFKQAVESLDMDEKKLGNEVIRREIFSPTSQATIQ